MKNSSEKLKFEMREPRFLGRKMGVLRNWQIIITTTLSNDPIHRVTTRLIVSACWAQTAKEKALKEYKNIHRGDTRMLRSPIQMKVIPLEEVNA